MVMADRLLVFQPFKLGLHQLCKHEQIAVLLRHGKDSFSLFKLDLSYERLLYAVMVLGLKIHAVVLSRMAHDLYLQHAAFRDVELYVPAFGLRHASYLAAVVV